MSIQKKLLTSICFTFILVFCGNAIASSNLYFASQPVSIYNYKSKIGAYNKALKEILVKVSANYLAEDDKKIKEILSKQIKISSFVTNCVDRVAGDQLFLDIQFDEKKVNKLLSDVGYRVLPSRRPVTILWLVQEDVRETKIIKSDNQFLIEQVLVNSSAKLGLPLILPILDLDDQQQVSIEDVLNFNFEPISFNAKNKYGADIILVGNYYEFDDTLNFNWQLLYKEDTLNWVSSSNSIKEEIDKIYEVIAENIYEKELIKVTENESTKNLVKVFIVGIDSIEKYTKVENYLKKLMLVKDVELNELNGDKASFALKTDSSKKDIINAIRMDGVLVENFSYSQNLDEDGNGSNNMEKIEENVPSGILVYKVNS